MADCFIIPLENGLHAQFQCVPKHIHVKWRDKSLRFYAKWHGVISACQIAFILEMKLIGRDHLEIYMLIWRGLMQSGKYLLSIFLNKEVKPEAFNEFGKEACGLNEDSLVWLLNKSKREKDANQFYLNKSTKRIVWESKKRVESEAINFDWVFSQQQGFKSQLIHSA